MARDYENLRDTDDLDDEELREMVRNALADNDGVDAENVTVKVDKGEVRLSGRVGTEGEVRTAEHILTDLLGLTRFRNNLVVDPLRRSMEPAGADDAIAEQSERDGILGDAPDQQSDTADHLSDHLEEEMFGTRDVREAIEGGESYTPPDGPTPEGLPGRGDTPDRYGENH